MATARKHATTPTQQPRCHVPLRIKGEALQRYCEMPRGHKPPHRSGAAAWVNSRRAAAKYVTGRGIVGSVVAPLPWYKRCDPVLLLLLLAFVAFELVAHFRYHNANGWWTLSNRITSFESKYGWPARAGVYALLVLLGIHLWGGVF